MDQERRDTSFHIKDCTLAALATGVHASTLIEFREKLAEADTACLFYHFWSGRLRPQFTHPEYPNDFAAWAHRQLHDLPLAEKLGVIDPIIYRDWEDVRKDILDIIDESLDEKDVILSLKKENQFHFIKSKILIFDTEQRIAKPEDLPAALPSFTLSSIFYHFIDAKRRAKDHIDDFSYWLKSFENHERLTKEIQQIDPYFISLSELRDKLTKITASFLTKA